MADALPSPARPAPGEVVPSADDVRRALGAAFTVALLPALVAALVYANTLLNGFVYDDPFILNWLKTRRWDLKGFLSATRGVTYAVHAFDRRLWGSWAPGFHLTNVLLHALASGLVGVTAWRLSRSRLVAGLTGVLFAVHPVHVESVANITNRKDVLALIFVLAGFLAWTGRLPGFARVALTAISYFLALYSKEVAAAGLVFVLFLADVLLPRRPELSVRARARESLSALAPLLLLGLFAGLYFARDLLAFFQADSILAKSGGLYSTYRESLATGAGNLVDVFRLLFFPLRLAIDYPIEPQASLFFDLRPLAGIALLAAWLGVALALARRAPLATFAMLWTVLAYLPASNLVPLHHILVAERYLYVPSFGFCLLLAVGFERALARLARSGRPAGRAALWSLAAFVLLAGAWRSFLRNADWRDIPALVAAADRDGVATWRIHKTAGAWAVWYQEWEEAARRYALAVEQRPGDADLQYWLAVCAFELGDVETAIRAGRFATLLKPDDAKAHYNLALALVQARDLAGAVLELRETIRLEGDYAPAHYNLGVALSLEGELDAARAAFEQCIAVDPDYAEAYFNLGALAAQAGDGEGALRAYRRAVLLDPHNARFLEEAAAKCLELGQPDLALAANRRLVEIEPENARALERLADLLAQSGELAEAANVYRKVAGLERTNARVLAKLGAACEGAGEADWARRAYRAAAELAPDDESVRRGLERLGEGGDG